MVEFVAVNWIIIAIEIIFGMTLTGIFFSEIFPMIRLHRVKYKFNDEFNLHVSKTGSTFMVQFIKSLVSLFLILVVIGLSYEFSGIDIPIIGNIFPSSLNVTELSIFLVAISIILLVIPKFIYNLVFPLYWIHQFKYFLLLGGFFLPLFLLDQAKLETVAFLDIIYPDFALWPNLLLPTQLLLENGYVLSPIEKQQLFLLLFIAVPLGYSLLSQILPKLIGRYKKFGLYEWKENAWQVVDDEEYEGDDDTALLLLHGLGSHKEMWNSYSREKGTQRIVDYIQDMLNERYIRAKIFSIDFSNRLKSPFSTDYKIKPIGKFSKVGKNTTFNNYVWELFYTIAVLKHVKEIERIHLICHSSGGLIVRKLLQEIYGNEELSEIREILEFDDKKGLYPFIDKVGWLAVPHFGAKGGESIYLSFRDTLIFKYLIRWFLKIPFVKVALNQMGRVFLALGLDAPAIHDIDPRNKFLRELNGPNKMVPLYGEHDYKNAVATLDQVIGNGGVIGDNLDHISLTFGQEDNFDERKFAADHSNAPWEQLSQLPKNQIHDYPPIHHSMEVFLWIMS